MREGKKERETGIRERDQGEEWRGETGQWQKRVEKNIERRKIKRRKRWNREGRGGER